jgi:hypothetical protein
MDSDVSPKLIDDQTKNYLFHTLNKCHTMRVKYHTIILNVGIFLFFCCLVGGTLYYLHITKPTETDKQYKMMKDQEYILSKIRYYQEQQQRIASSASSYSSTITDLPIVPNVGNI